MVTLILATLMLMMTTAFFYTQQDQLRFQRQSEGGLKAKQAALSGLDYARMRLEADPLWGLPKSNHDRNLSIPGLQIFEDDQMGSGAVRSFCCVGVLGDGESHFQINLWVPGQVLADQSNGRISSDAIVNNPTGPLSAWAKETLPQADVSLNYLNGTTFSPPLRSSLQTAPQRTLPPRQCLLQIRGVSGKDIRVLEVTLGAEKQTEASFQAGGTLDVSTKGSGQWNIESVVAGKNRVESGGKMVVSGSPTNTAVKFGYSGEGASNGAIQASAMGVQQVIDLGDGTLQVNHKDTPLNLNLSGSPNANSNSGGKFKPNTGVGTPPDLSATSVEGMLNNANYTAKSMPGGTYTFTGPNTISVNGGAGQSNDLHSSSGTKVAKIENYKLIFEEGFRLDFDGPTTIKGTGGNKPSVLMGYDKNGWLPWNSEGTFLKVANGNLSVDGSLAGKGSVMATGNSTTEGSIYMRGKSQMAADPDSAVTLYAERNIKVAPPDPTSAEFFSVDLAAISQSMESYAPNGGPWNSGTRPLNQFANLAADDQNYHVQGGASPVDDSDVSGGSIKTAPINSNLPELKDELGAQFPVLLADPQAQVEYDRLFDRFTTPGDPTIATPGLTAGRYLRMREFLREMQQAHNAGNPLPSSDPLSPDFSAWADVNRKNQKLNDQLRAEISYFDRQHGGLGFSSLRSMITAGPSKNPSNNPLTSSMNARDARWTGLMYARGSVALDTGGGSLDVRGSLVARNEIAVTNATSVRTVYDPVYLNGLTRFAIGNGVGTKLALYFYRIR